MRRRNDLDIGPLIRKKHLLEPKGVQKNKTRFFSATGTRSNTPITRSEYQTEPEKNEVDKPIKL